MQKGLEETWTIGHTNFIPTTYQRHGVTMTVIDSNVYSASISRKKSAQPKCASCMNHIRAITLFGQARFSTSPFCRIPEQSSGISYIGQERKGHINLRKIPGTPAGCPWDTRRDKQGSTGRCPRDFLLFFAIEKQTEKGTFAGTPAGCPRDTRPSRRFSETLCDFFLCAFSAP